MGNKFQQQIQIVSRDDIRPSATLIEAAFFDADGNPIEFGGGGGGSTAWNDITGKPAVIAAGANEAAARDAIGAGTSDLVIGTSAGTAGDGEVLAGKAEAVHTHVGTDVTLTGYAIGTTPEAAVAAADTVNSAIAKLEKRIADLEGA